MKEKLIKFVNSKNSLSNGFLAFLVIALITLGCTCNGKNLFDSGDDKSNSSNSSTKEDGKPFETPEAKKVFEKADASKGEIPSDEELQEMVKTTLLNFNDAIQQKDFSDFHKTISEIWQKQTTPKTFEDGFKKFMDLGINIGQIKSQQATFSPKPGMVTEEGVERLRVQGSYPTSPVPSTFKLDFIAEGKEWKLFLIEVYSASK